MLYLIINNYYYLLIFWSVGCHGNHCIINVEDKINKTLSLYYNKFVVYDINI